MERTGGEDRVADAARTEVQDEPRQLRPMVWAAVVGSASGNNGSHRVL